MSESEGNESSTGLYEKYEVRKNGDPIEGCFVLEPESDPAAREAMARYAGCTDNDELASDIREWLGIEASDGGGHDLVKCEGCGRKIHESRGPVCATCERRGKA